MKKVVTMVTISSYLISQQEDAMVTCDGAVVTMVTTRRSTLKF